MTQIVSALVDLDAPTQEAYQNIRDGVIKIPVDDSDITDSDLNSIIAQARANAHYEYFKDRQELTAAELAQRDLYAFSQLYVSAESSYQAAIRLAEYVLESGEYLAYEPAAGMSPASAWLLWADDAVIEIGFKGKLSDASVRSIKSDIKHRYPALALPLMAQSVNLSILVDRTDSRNISVNGVPVEMDKLALDLRMMARDMQDGEERTIDKVIGPDYIASHPALIRELGPLAKNIDTDTDEGREDFEQLIEMAVTRTQNGLRDFMRCNDNHHPDYVMDTGQVFISETPDENGELKCHYRLVIKTDSPANLEYYKTQVSARCEFAMAVTEL